MLECVGRFETDVSSYSEKEANYLPTEYIITLLIIKDLRADIFHIYFKILFIYV
jgi:hypothetical protein